MCTPGVSGWGGQGGMLALLAYISDSGQQVSKHLVMKPDPEAAAQQHFWLQTTPAMQMGIRKVGLGLPEFGLKYQIIFQVFCLKR